MKTFTYILILFISITSFAQNSIEKKIGEFSELKVYDLIEVELIKANDNKIIITGKNTGSVLVNNKNGTLKIKMKLEEAFDGNKTKVKLYYSNVDILDANEGSYIHSKDVIKQFEIDLNAQEGGKIEVKLKTKYVNVRAVTGASIITSGSSIKQNVSIYTGGEYNGKNLKTDISDVSIRVAGNAIINAHKKVISKVRAGGNIYIYGNPKEVDESKVLGGKIEVIKE
jgi:hypothetical protein